ncbi:hypothetical protein QkW1_72 [Ralstonia phage QkW1]|nr:transcriptional regulator [Ralstonia phage RPZH6]UAW01004.1 transcriptional regulator [Ralstonia phage RPZH3]WRQ05471.1 transcriptional regulator [Ralstonia phage AhaGv]
MNMLTELDVTGPSARALRKSLGMKQTEFWNRIGLSQSCGCRYEREGSPIPLPYQRLIFLHYVAGLPVDAGSKESAARLVELGTISKDAEKVARLRAAAAKADSISAALKGAVGAASEISAAV